MCAWGLEGLLKFEQVAAGRPSGCWNARRTALPLHMTAAAGAHAAACWVHERHLSAACRLPPADVRLQFHSAIVFMSRPPAAPLPSSLRAATIRNDSAQ